MTSYKKFENSEECVSLLCNALDIQSQASKFGFEWLEVGGILEKIREEVKEIEKEISRRDIERVKKEVGDLYLVSLHLAQFLGIDPLECLYISYETFRRRWEKVQLLATDVPEVPEERLEYLERLWSQVKQEETDFF
ncbi:MAG: hypothetical protein LDL53_01935 [Candidatus Hydrogenedens sp.]|nr:hypothetical protein [Candidatus Hydrogenedens sp.]